MTILILLLCIMIVVTLNILFVYLYNKFNFSLFFSGIILSVLAPVFGFTSGWLFYEFYNWSDGGTGEGAGYGGQLLE